jgi:hypothetical protein
MLFQANFGFWDKMEMGLYYIIVGYFVLLFFYFLFMRYRTSRKIFWLFYSVLFICFGIGRVFFIIYYFYAPELYTGTNGDEVVAFLMLNYRLATFFTWIGTACAVGLLGTLLFPPDTQMEETGEKAFSVKNWFKNKNNIRILIRFGLFIIPLVIGIVTLVLPDNLFIDPDFIDDYGITIQPVNIVILGWEYPIGRFVWNFIFMPLFVALIPFVFLYLAWKTFGVLRRSYALNAIGFFLYFIGRISQGVLDVLGLPHVRAIAPPLIILLALLIMVIANTYEQLK